MARGRSPFKAEKRRKELKRIKKQEEKRKKRNLAKAKIDSPEAIDGSAEPAAEPAPESAAGGGQETGLEG